MTTVLHIGCSPRGSSSESFQLSRHIVDMLLHTYPAAHVVNRMIGGNAMLHVDADYAMSQKSAFDVSNEGSMIESEELIRELESADIVVVGTPVHNFTVPSALKAWIDHVVRVRRTFDVSPGGKVPLLHDRPVLIAASSGGRFTGEHARQPDFLRPYLEAILGIIGLHDVTFFTVEGTSAGSEALTQSREQARRAVREHFATLRSAVRAVKSPSTVAMPSADERSRGLVTTSRD
ncbi:MAG TPA: NAD(P)H-dependent oxidoreductase [Lysobacter sp.]